MKFFCSLQVWPSRMKYCRVKQNGPNYLKHQTSFRNTSMYWAAYPVGHTWWDLNYFNKDLFFKAPHQHATKLHYMRFICDLLIIEFERNKSTVIQSMLTIIMTKTIFLHFLLMGMIKYFWCRITFEVINMLPMMTLRNDGFTMVVVIQGRYYTCKAPLPSTDIYFFTVPFETVCNS